MSSCVNATDFNGGELNDLVITSVKSKTVTILMNVSKK